MQWKLADKLQPFVLQKDFIFENREQAPWYYCRAQQITHKTIKV